MYTFVHSLWYKILICTIFVRKIYTNLVFCIILVYILYGFCTNFLVREVWEESNEVFGTLNGYREEGVEKSVTRCLHSKCHPFYPTHQHHVLAGFRKEVLKQYQSYEISKHHQNLCPKGCSSSFPRQIEIMQVCDYNVIQHP